MDEINSIIQLAAQTLLDKYGDDFRLEEGDSKVFTLNNGTLVLSIDNGELDVQLINGEPIKLDVTYSMFK